MTNVLVPVDGSECATRAVRWVASVLAGQRGAYVHLVHVQPAIDAWEVRSHLGADDIAKFQTSGAPVLEPAATIVREAGVAVDTHDVVGDDVAAQIAAHVQSLHCDAIVMGTRGLGPVQSLLLGSITLRVIHLADVPVTLIK